MWKPLIRVNYKNGHCGLSDFPGLVTKLFFRRVTSLWFPYVTDPIHIRIEMIKKHIDPSSTNVFIEVELD